LADESHPDHDGGGKYGGFFYCHCLLREGKGLVVVEGVLALEIIFKLEDGLLGVVARASCGLMLAFLLEWLVNQAR
jgi:hypothetical protein